MITARDRKIVLALVPLLILVGYWFMALAPKRAESQKVSQELSKAQTARDAAEQQVAQLNAAKASFSTDYATVIRLGKAVPTSLDMPSLLVQLDRASRGTGIDFTSIKTGARAATAATASPARAAVAAPRPPRPAARLRPAAPAPAVAAPRASTASRWTSSSTAASSTWPTSSTG